LSSELPVRGAKGIMFNKYSASCLYTAEQQGVANNVFIEMYLL